MKNRDWHGRFAFQDLTGKRFGKLSVIKEANRRGSKILWECICDCGNIANVDISNLNGGHTRSCGCLGREMLDSQHGSKHPNWKGGRHTKDGYVYIHKPTHPNAHKSGYIMEHRIVMEEKLGRYLCSTESVHHRNGVKSDNRPENLELRAIFHGKGQNIDDLICWAKEILSRYDNNSHEKEEHVELSCNKRGLELANQ